MDKNLIAELQEIGVERASVVDLHPTNIFVLMCPGVLRDFQIERIKAMIAGKLAGVSCMVLTEGMTFSVLRKVESDDRPGIDG